VEPAAHRYCRLEQHTRVNVTLSSMWCGTLIGLGEGGTQSQFRAVFIGQGVTEHIVEVR
jgi:hypothetical protein